MNTRFSDWFAVLRSSTDTNLTFVRIKRVQDGFTMAELSPRTFKVTGDRCDYPKQSLLLAVAFHGLDPDLLNVFRVASIKYVRLVISVTTLSDPRLNGSAEYVRKINRIYSGAASFITELWHHQSAVFSWLIAPHSFFVGA